MDIDERKAILKTLDEEDEKVISNRIRKRAESAKKLTVQQITTVGKLRKFLKTVPDETEIWAQVVDTNGGAWNLEARIGDVMGGVPRKLVISLRHPNLTNLSPECFKE